MRYGEIKKRESNFTVCPRCGLKSLSITESCPECGLVFSRLKIATNKDAKRKIWRRDTDFIIKTNKLPSDINKYKLYALVLLTGLFGGHCFYVGRYWRGGLLLLNGLMLIMCAVFNQQLVAVDGGGLVAVLGTIGGIIMLIWMADIVWIFTKRFKVPIAIDLQSENSEEIVVNSEIDQMPVSEERNGEKEYKEEKESNEDSSRD